LGLWQSANQGVTTVAIDGYGASGKSTIAARLCSRTGACLVRTDDFFLPSSRRPGAGEPGEPGRARSAPGGESGRLIASFYDLRRLRAEALEPLRAGQEAVFYGFDWHCGAIASLKTRVEPKELVLVEGVCSAAPQLSDLVDRAIFVDTPEPERLSRLRGRIAPQDWDWEWLQAEKQYFSTTRPRRSFDLVISGTNAGPEVPDGARAPGEAGARVFRVNTHREGRVPGRN
jgi:para-aminobenzoate synthetase